MTLLLGPATVVTQAADGRVLQDAGVLIEGESIAAVGDFKTLNQAHPKAQHIDAHGGTVMPGFVNAHAHFYGIFSRGMALKDDPPQTFRQVLERL